MTRSVIDHLHHMIRKGGYKPKIDHEMNRLMETLFLVDGKKSGNPEFDPALHDLHKDNSIWIELCNEENTTIAISAARLVETHDLIGLTRTYRLWYGDRIRFMDPIKIVAAPDVIIPSGRLVLDGAMWVRHDHRRLGLSWVLGRLIKAVTFESWNPDWFFGIAFPGIASSRLPIYSYGYERLDRFASGYHLPGYTSHDLSLATLSRDEYAVLTAKDLALLESPSRPSIGSEFAQQVRAGKRDAPPPPEHRAAEPANTIGIAG